MTSMSLVCTLAGGLAAASAIGATRAPEFGASAWAEGQRSAARLLGGGARSNDGSIVRAGIEIKLEPGYKTYWRSPGDSGIPPAFDWSGSENVSGVAVRFPAPERFEDPAGFSIGYTNDVVLPLAVRIADPAKPVRLALKLNYAVCNKLCIPVEAKLAMVLPHRSGQSVLKLLAESRVPRPAALGAVMEGLAVIRVASERSGDAATLLVAISANEGDVVDVFAEAPGLWLFGKPVLERADSGETIARIPIDDRPKDAIGAVPLILTVVGASAAIEVTTDLDAGPIAR